MDMFSEAESYSELCRWSDGTHCWIEDLQDYLMFMSDDFEIIWVPHFDLQAVGVM